MQTWHLICKLSFICPETKMKRIAIVIGCDFPKNHPSHLPGVSNDFYEIQKYLHSDFGGGWLSSEIIPLVYPTKGQLLHSLKSAENADLVWVYFSGHGFQWEGKTYIQIRPDESFSAKNLWVVAKRQVVMIDACRNEVLDDTIPFIGDIEHIFPTQHIQLARRLFANLLMTSPQGRILFQSSRSGQSSLDTPTGGLFTKTFLSHIKSWGWGEQHLSATFDSFTRNFPDILSIGSDFQNPQIKYNSVAALQIPLAVNPRLIANQATQKQSLSRPTTGNFWRF